MFRTGPIIVFGSGVAASARCLTANATAIAITNRTAKAVPPLIAELIHVRMAASCRTSQTGSKLAPTTDRARFAWTPLGRLLFSASVQIHDCSENDRGCRTPRRPALSVLRRGSRRHRRAAERAQDK